MLGDLKSSIMNATEFVKLAMAKVVKGLRHVSLAKEEE